jgi:hypothetical protein
MPAEAGLPILMQSRSFTSPTNLCAIFQFSHYAIYQITENPKINLEWQRKFIGLKMVSINIFSCLLAYAIRYVM